MKKELTIIEKLMSSFDNHSMGFSARKLSAFIAVMVAIYSTVHYVDGTTIVNVLMVWLTFALMCLGIITAEQVLRFKGQQPEPEKPKEEQSNNDKQEDPKI